MSLSETIKKVIVRFIFKDEGTAKETSKVEDAIGALEGKLLDLGKAFLTVKTLQEAWELAELGAYTQRAEVAFERVSGGALAAQENLDAMMQASNYTLSRMDAMQAATKLLQMGLADSADELEHLTRIAIRLGGAMGEKPMEAINDFALMLANQAIPRLDNFGMSSGWVRKRIAELRSEFPDMTRETAFMTAVLEAGDSALEKLGDTARDSATSFERLGAEWDNFKRGAGKSMADFFADAARGAAYLLHQINAQTYEIEELKRYFGEATVEMAANAGAMGNSVQYTLDDLSEMLDRLKREMSTTWEAGDAGVGAFLRQAGAARELADATGQAADETERLAWINSQIKDILADSSEVLRLAGAKSADYAAAQEAIRILTGDLTKEELQHKKQLQAVAQAYVDGKMTAWEYAQRVLELKRSWGEVPEEVHTAYYVETHGTVPDFVTGQPRQFFASGGVSSGGWAVVGEEGPELLYLPAGTRVYNNQQYQRNVQQVVVVQGANSRLLEELTRSLDAPFI